ncbi:MAG: hypothetical protein ACJA2W_000731 [Planctomycetota bacterium]|jgi:hypothetical protein
MIGCLLASACSSAAKGPVSEVMALRSSDDAVQVRAGDEVFARVPLNAAQPGVIETLFGHGGRHILRGFPQHPRFGESVDHPEHLSMWMGHASVGGFDLWNEAAGPRLVEHSLRMQPGGGAVVVMKLEWQAPSGKVLCSEDRVYTFRGTDQVRDVDVEIRLTATGDGVVFGDVREGFFALRLADGFRVDSGNASVQTSTQIEGHDPYGQPARWIAYTAPIADEMGALEDVTVSIFDSPGNPGYPTRWFARPYGLVAANPFAATAFEDSDAPHQSDDLLKPTVAEGFWLKPYQSAAWRYRVAIARGALDGSAIESQWMAFTGVGSPKNP